MEEDLEQPAVMNPMISQAVITGGTFNQQSRHHHDNRYFYVQVAKSGFDRLQEAVAHTAFHNSGERFDPPKCHPNTRVAVMQKIMDWILGRDPDTRDALIMWLNGAAGAGKSAIAQSIAELCFSQGRLAASFFFGRSDPTRNHARSLVATIVYQIYSKVPRDTQSRIISVIDNDPLIFTRSLITQFEVLIIQPLRHLLDSGYFNSDGSPSLILIDGLDECQDQPIQRNILDTLLNAIRQFHTPFIFLVSSRPEHDLQAAFSSSEMIAILTRLTLDDTYLPDKDIELFLRDRFNECKANHSFKHLIPSPWPSDEVITNLIYKSSGQFIYAATVIKYVTSSRHRPHHRLEVVLNIRPPSRDLPFAELDALYTHIFSSVEDFDLVRHIISFEIIYRNLASIDDIEKVLALDPGDVSILLCDLVSIIGQRQGHTGRPHLHIMHASLSDFLLEPTRSKEFYINIPLECIEHARKCFQFLTRTTFDASSESAIPTAIFFFEYNYHRIGLTPELSDDIIKFSIPRVYNAASDASAKGCPRPDVLQQFNFRFLTAFFSFIRNSQFESADHLYGHHLKSYDQFLMQHLQSYYADVRLALQLALVGLSYNHNVLPVGALHHDMRLFDSDSHLADMDDIALQLLWICPGDRHYIKLIACFLGDRGRSKQYTLGEQTFTGGAICCMTYLCNHHSLAQMVPPRHSIRQREKRKITPWAWNRRVIKHGELGKNTPWMWLRKPGEFGQLYTTRILHKKQGDLIYIHNHHLDTSMPSESDDPVVFHRMWSEKYYLALHYLLYFLPRSGRSDTLIEFCQRHAFASRSQDFPGKSKKARRAVAEYLERMKSGEERLR